jgi:P27 family predicted phage terminase small subunit
MKRKFGNPGHRALPKPSQTFALVSAEGDAAPITLGPAGRELWHQTQNHAPWLSQLDLMLLEDLALTWDQVTEMRQIISEDGVVLLEPDVTPAGFVIGDKKVAHPLIRELRTAQKQLHSIASTLGFDPPAAAASDWQRSKPTASSRSSQTSAGAIPDGHPQESALRHHQSGTFPIPEKSDHSGSRDGLRPCS